MTYSNQEPKIINEFDRIEFLVDGERKQIPSQQMLEALVHFPKPDALDLYRLEHYRQKFNLRNRQYNSEENQQILRYWSDRLINDFGVYSLSETVHKVSQWCKCNNLNYEKYFYGRLMSSYCYDILPLTTSRYTAISGKLETAIIQSQVIIKELEIAERDSPEDIRRLKILQREADAKHKSLCRKYPYYKKSNLFVESLKRRFPEFRDILPEYSSLHQQLMEDIDIRNLFVVETDDIAKYIRKAKANKSAIEEAHGTEVELISQCVFCYKFHLQTTKKREGSEKTALVRYCPECKEYNSQWANDKYTPNRRDIPVNGW